MHRRLGARGQNEVDGKIVAGDLIEIGLRPDDVLPAGRSAHVRPGELKIIEIIRIDDGDVPGRQILDQIANSIGGSARRVVPAAKGRYENRGMIRAHVHSHRIWEICPPLAALRQWRDCSAVREEGREDGWLLLSIRRREESPAGRDNRIGGGRLQDSFGVSPLFATFVGDRERRFRIRPCIRRHRLYSYFLCSGAELPAQVWIADAAIA